MTSHPSTEQLASLLDETADDASRESMTGHLKDCSSCRVALDELRQLTVLIKESESARTSGDWYGRWRDRVEDGPRVVSLKPRLSRYWTPWTGMAVAASLVVLLLGYPAYRGLTGRGADWAGPVPSLVVSEYVSRGAPGGEPHVLRLARDQPHVIVSLQPPDPLAPDGTYRVEIRGAEGASVWSMDIAGADLDAAEKTDLGLMLISIPTSTFRTGDYRLEFKRVDTPDPESKQTLEFEIAFDK